MLNIWFVIMLPLVGLWLAITSIVFGRILWEKIKIKRVLLLERLRRTYTKNGYKTEDEETANRERIRQLFVSQCKRQICQRKEQLLKDERELSTKLRELERISLKNKETLQESQIILEGEKTQLETLKQKAAESFNKISSEEMVASISINPAYIIVRTRPISIEHKGTTYLLGEYILQMGLNGKILVNRSDRNTPIHPHVAKNGEPAFTTDLRLAIIGFMVNYDLLEIVQIMLGFLQSYDETSALYNITDFSTNENAAEATTIL